MNFIEQLLGIENRWAVLGILVALQVIICIVVSKATKKPLWGWLTLIATAVFIIVYIWKYPWLFRIVGALIAFGPGELATVLSLPQDQPDSFKAHSSPIVDEGTKQFHKLNGTLVNFGPRSQSYYASLRGKTVYHPLLEKTYEYIAFLCVDILGLEASEVNGDSDFNNDLGADSLDCEEFITHLAEEVFFPEVKLAEARKWMNFLMYEAEANEKNGSHRFPMKTVKDMTKVLMSFFPDRIEFPK